jgi:hypothetical protein
VALSSLATAVVAVGASALTLVQEGEPVSVIVTGNNPVPIQKLAAEELQYHLKKMTNATVPIVAEKDLGDRPGVRILVGQSDLLNARGIDTTALPRETFIVKTLDGALVLAGEDGGDVNVRKARLDNLRVRAGTLYAVYDLLQDQLGVRWVWPGELGEVIPKRPTVTLGELDIQETPKLFQRYWRQGTRGKMQDAGGLNFPRYIKARKERLDELFEEETLWLKRMKMGASYKLPYGHAFTQDYEERRLTMPEIYAMQPDGHRGLPNEAYPPEMVKICVTEPKLMEMVVEDFKRLHGSNPNFHYMNACENDGGTGYCVCERCLEQDKLPEGVAHEFPPMGIDGNDLDWPSLVSPRGRDNDSLSNRYFRFYNMVARRLKEIDPEARVVAYAYSRFRYLPVGVEVEPNMLLGIMLFSFYPRTEDMRQIHTENLIGWKKTGVELFFRPNSFYYNPACGIPWSAAHQMGDDLSFVLSQDVQGTDFDSLAGFWATEAPTMYVLARMHWDTDATSEQLLSEWCSAFGPAAQPVQDYFAHWEKVFTDAYTRPDSQQIQDKAGNDTPWGRFRGVGLLITDEDFARGRAFLQQARDAAEAAGDADLLQRIHVLELGLKHGELTVRTTRMCIEKQSFDDDTYYEELWPLVQETFKVREEMADLHSFNPLWLNWFEYLQHDMHGTRVWHDFFERPWQPVMTPAENKWSFVPDPQGIGEEQGWPERSIAESNILRWGPYFHIFYANWDRCRPTTVWKRETGEKAVVNGWYQAAFSVPEKACGPDAVLYIPYIAGEGAKVWVDGRLIREVDKAGIASREPVVISVKEAGIEPDKEFRLTIKVNAPTGGGLIGPVYVAKPAG